MPVADNFLDQQFTVDCPNAVWLTDLTYIATDEGWLYLAGHKDMFTGEIVGYALAEKMTKSLVRACKTVKSVVPENTVIALVMSSMTCAAKLKEKAQAYTVFFLYGKQREVLAYSQTGMLKMMRCPVRVVWRYRQTWYLALMTTDLTLSVKQIIEFYGARWKIEAGFKEIKQEIGSSKSQTRNADAVLNHLNFCMLTTTLTWVYADRLQCAPDRKYKIRGRTGFAFSDVRRIIGEAGLHQDFNRFAHCQRKDHKNLS